LKFAKGEIEMPEILLTTIEIPKEEYNQLIRESEKLAIIERMLAKEQYVSASDMRMILGIEEEGEKKDGESENI